MTDRWMPAPHQLGPDPEPLPPRFEVLLAFHIEAQRRRPSRPLRLEPARPATKPAAGSPALAA